MKKLSITLLVFAFLQCFGYAQTTLPFSEDWESGSFNTNGWTVSIGDGQAAINNMGLAGSQGLKVDFATGHTGNLPVTIESPWISTAGVSSGMLALNLHYKYTNPAGKRWVFLRIFNDTGNGWELMNEFSHYASFSWRDYKNLVRCSANSQVRVKFEILPDSLSAYGSWYLDGILVNEIAPITYEFPLTINAKVVGNAPLMEAKWAQPLVHGGNSFVNDTVHYYTENAALPLYFIDTIQAVGVVYPIESFPETMLYGLEFRQALNENLPLSYRYPFKVYLLDWDTKTFIDTLGPFITNGPTEWVTQIPLNLASYPTVKNLGVFVNPLDLYVISFMNYIVCPMLTCDYIETTSSFGLVLNTPPTFYQSGIGGSYILQLLLLNPKDGKIQKLSANTPTYNLHRWQESLPLNYTLMNTTPLSDTAYFDAAVEKGWYSYFVEATYPNQQVLYSDTARAYMPTSAGVSTMGAAQVSLYPNPATNSLYVKSAQPMAGINVFNGQGQLVAESMLGTATETVLQLSGYAPGLYVARLRFANGSNASHTFIKE